MQLVALIFTAIVFSPFLSAESANAAARRAAAPATAWAHDPTGPRFQYDRFRKGCFDAAGSQGMNAGLVGECGNLDRVDLSGRDLTGVNLRGASLKGAIIENAKLDNSDLREANLLYSNWEKTTFRGARFNSDTILPFDAKQASTFGMTTLEYKDLDANFLRTTTTWLGSRPTTMNPQVIQMIRDGADYLAVSGDILHTAIGNSALVFLDYIFVQRKLDPNATYTGFRPYLVTVLNGYAPNTAARKSMLQFFLKIGADPNIVDASGSPLLWIAANREDLTSIDVLLNVPVSTRTLVKGNSLLYTLVKAGRVSTATYLMGRTADSGFCRVANAPCSLLETAFQFRTSSVQALLDAGVSPAVTYFTGSMFDYATDYSMLEQLAILGANGKKAAVHNRTDISIIEFLLNQGASIDSQDASGKTLLMNAIKTSNKKLIDFVLTTNFNVNMRDVNGISAFGYLFVDQRMAEMYLSAFLAKGVNPNQLVYRSTDFKNTSPVLLQVYKSAPKFFMPLARAGANINQPVEDTAGKRSYAVAYILNVWNPKAVNSDKEFLELTALGADFKTWFEIPEIDVPKLNFVSENDPPHFRISKRARKKVSVSLAAEAARTGKKSVLAVLKQSGVDLNGRQTSTGATLAHFANTAGDLQDLEKLGVALDGLDDNGQNAMYGKSAEFVDELIRRGVPVQKSDRLGDSILAYADYDVCRIDTNWLQRMIGMGLDPNQVSARYNLSLAHMIAYSISRQGESACATKVFTDLKSQKLDLNRTWKVDRSAGVAPVDGYGLLGMSLNWLEDTYTTTSIESDSAFVERRAFLDLMKLWNTLGYDATTEAAQSGTEFSSLIERAYRSNNIELVNYLKRSGLIELPRITAPTSAVPAAQACDFFGTSANYQPGGAGCLSKQTGMVWSEPKARVVGSASFDAHTAFCRSLGGDWRVPVYSDLMREFFTGEAKSGFTTYRSTKKDSREMMYAFNPSDGDNIEVDAKISISFVCRYRLEDEL